MRFNVIYNGKRTTARLPEELWELFAMALDYDGLDPIFEVQSFFKDREEERKALGRDFSITVSEALRSFVTGWLRCSLKRSSFSGLGND